MCDEDWDAPSPVTKNAISENAKDFTPGDIKIILLGDSAVGKSKLIERFLMNRYTKHTASTYAVNIFTYRYENAESGKKYIIDFWDTAGQEQFDNLHPSFYYEANCCILAFDVTRKVTYKNLEKWYSECKNNCIKEIPTLCIANKIGIFSKIFFIGMSYYIGISILSDRS